MTGHVTTHGEVKAGRIGEVRIEIRGGTETFCAHPADPEDILPPFTRIVVVDDLGGRHVKVAAA